MKVKLQHFLNKTSSLLYPYLILLALCILLMFFFTKEELYFAVNRIHTVFTDVFFTRVTQLGASAGCIIISGIVILINYRKGFLLASSYLLTFIISQTIKHLVQAPRPHLFFAKKLSGIYMVKGVVMLDTNSFPSGHSVSAFTAALVLTYVAKKKWWGPLMLLLAVLVAYSRMYLSEHFLVDVTAGSALGILVTAFWLMWIDQQPFLQTENWNSGIFSRKKK
ncbi:phosphatase PAP2 family protein [Mucilaginibacter arboris]|uniref:Phosphatase PAP2 family protein n=1 Tax=Mucilaginibacter arboris TaxID=2682090 RepID=A0A7K1SUE3_9SPHI|nr:phosphatase PAP2 family protein [Mucilaginibacter arboris]MVN20941.1 phosphatase PAP2 family protein [Mucilaginibacter arboris]